MRPDGVNGSVPAQQAQQPSLAERIDNVNASDTTNLSNNINDISTDVNKKIQEFFSQGSEDNEKISVNEQTEIGKIKTSLSNLYYNMRNKYVQAEQEVAKTYKQLLDNLLDLINRTTDASNGKNPNEVALEPQETDAEQQKINNIPSEKEFLSSVSADIQDAYLRIVNPENYGGHGGSLSVAQKSPNAKVGGLTGILREYGNVLTEGQTVFLEREIARWKEIAKIEQNEQEEGTNETLYQGQTTYGSHFYDNPENGKKLAETMHNVYTREGLTLANARKVIGLDEE